MKDITPKEYRCGLGQCPAVYRLDDGRIAVRGLRVWRDKQYGKDVVSGDEVTVLIDPEMIVTAVAPADASNDAA